jgi:hypothetical protein
LFTVLSVQAQTSEFSADVVNTSAGMGTTSGKIYVSKDKTRMEMEQAIVIARMDKKVSWVIMPLQKQYMEQAIDPRSVAGTDEKMPGELERTLVGKETVDGRSTEKYRITYNAMGKKETVFQWLDPRIKIPVKTAAEDGSWSMEFRNIHAGPQADSLFEVPAGYSKFSMLSPSDMTSMIQKQLPKDMVPQEE